MFDLVIEPVISIPVRASTSSEMSKERRERRGKGKNYRRNNKGTIFREVKFTGHTKELKKRSMILPTI